MKYQIGNIPHNKGITHSVETKKKLRDKGYRVLVFWENEIRVMRLNNLEEIKCIQK